MRAVNVEMERAVSRATELTEELGIVLGYLRSATSLPGEPVADDRSILDTAVLGELIEALGSADEVTTLAASFAGGLSGRADELLATDLGDEQRARRLLADMRSAGELLGATGLAAWCRQRAVEPATASAEELRSLVDATRRALTVWRLTLLDGEPAT